MARASAALIPQLPLWSWMVALPLPVPRDGQLLTITLALSSLVGFIGYGIAVYLSWNRQPHAGSLRLALATAVLLFLVTACALPNVNTDIYNYIVSARVATEYAANPYDIPPDQFPDDPVYPYAGHQYTTRPDNKLPTWMLISLPVAAVAGDDVITNLLMFRLTFLLFNAANLALIVMILRQRHPRHQLTGVLLYGWNPIVVVYGQSKTDTVMVFFVLLAILLLTTRRQQLAVVALGLSMFVKLITVPLVIVYWLQHLRLKRWRQLLVDTVVLGLTALVIYAPFLRRPDLLLEHVGLLRGGGSSAPNLVQPVLTVAFLLLILWVGLTRDGSHALLLRGWLVVIVFFFLFLTRLGFSWYLMTLIALVSVVVDGRVALITVILSFPAFLLNARDAAAAGGSPLPNLVDLPRFVVYLAFLGIVVLGGAAVVGWRSHQRRRVYGSE